ncbi:MAG: hypothetical protein J3K34DRAFT_409330 [Monoraphidium minutum]|nr:MAG: hypothetical protein J3K34DRAFT_409330 [Monoraphidium minutum]
MRRWLRRRMAASMSLPHSASTAVTAWSSMPGKRPLRASRVAGWTARNAGEGPEQRPEGLPAKYRPRLPCPLSQGDSISSECSSNSRLEPEKGLRAVQDI